MWPPCLCLLMSVGLVQHLESAVLAADNVHASRLPLEGEIAVGGRQELTVGCVDANPNVLRVPEKVAHEAEALGVGGLQVGSVQHFGGVFDLVDIVAPLHKKSTRNNVSI